MNNGGVQIINGVIRSVIRPVLHDLGFGDVKAAHEINELGSINNQIISRIINDDLVIANLTGNNPNVMYELCLRHAVAKPVIHICENGTSLPFDIKGERTIFYSNDMLGSEELKEHLGDILKTIDYAKEYKDNPIYTAVNIDKVLKDSDEPDGIGLIIDMLQNMSKNILLCENNKRNLNSRKPNFGLDVIIQEDRKEFLDSLSKFLIKQLDITVEKIGKSGLLIWSNSEEEREKVRAIVLEQSMQRGVQVDVRTIISLSKD